MTPAPSQSVTVRTSKPRNWGSEVTTPVFGGQICVRVFPEYLPDHSDFESGRWVFAYRIRITNECDREVRLVSRRWEIIDADGDRKVVQGLGVVGEQPVIAPGHSFEYSSGCELATPWGTMEGLYRMESVAGNAASEVVEARVGRFFLVSKPTS